MVAIVRIELSDPMTFTFIDNVLITFFKNSQREVFTSVLSNCTHRGMITVSRGFGEVLLLSSC